jgi:hypothetical protein
MVGLGGAGAGLAGGIGGAGAGAIAGLSADAIAQKLFLKRTKRPGSNFSYMGNRHVSFGIR